MSAEGIAKNRDWREKRIDAINRQITRFGGKRDINEYYADEHLQICQSKCKTKKEYKIWIQTNGRV